MEAGKVAYFDGLKKDIQEYFGKKGQLKSRKAGFVKNLSNPSSTVLFFNIQSKEDLEKIRAVLKYAEKSKGGVVAYIFCNSYTKMDLITNKSIYYFDLNDITLFAKKKEELQKRFDKDCFELAISFVTPPNALSNKFFADLQADFKVGMYFENHEHLFDLTINTKTEKIDFMDYYKQVIHYLSVLNIKTT